MDFQAEKAVARSYHAALDRQDWKAAGAHLLPDCRWRGYHPFNELTGAEAINTRFWQPLHDSFRHLQRREDIFFAGQSQVAEGNACWVVSMGHLTGLFDTPWLGIPATGRMTFLRYCSFLKVEADRISDIAMFFDIPQVMVQAGLAPMPEQTGAQIVQPGPMTHDGLLYTSQPEAEGVATLALIEAMIADLGNWQSGLPLEEELRRTWAEDMIWWGPTGIGATYTVPRYAAQHAGPFRASFTDRAFNGHVARVAEGQFGGFFGWPNFTARLAVDYQGLPTAGQVGEFRVIDIYRRAGDRLAENWVFIDMPHFWLSQGIRILPETG